MVASIQFEASPIAACRTAVHGNLWAAFRLQGLASITSDDVLTIGQAHNLIESTDARKQVYAHLLLALLDNQTVIEGVASPEDRAIGSICLKSLVKKMPSAEFVTPEVRFHFERVTCARSDSACGELLRVSASVDIDLEPIVIQGELIRLLCRPPVNRFEYITAANRTAADVTASGKAPAHQDWTSLFRIAFSNQVNPFSYEEMLIWLEQASQTDESARAWVNRIIRFENEKDRWIEFVRDRLDPKDVPSDKMRRTRLHQTFC